MMDIVFPNKNEKEFVEMAKKLGYKTIVFAYPTAVTPPKITAEKLQIKTAVIAPPKKAGSIKGQKLVIVESSDNDRQVLEQGSADILFGLEVNSPRDFAHQRASGLNHILCAIAKKKNVAIGFAFRQLLEAKPQQRAIMIGRIQQNIKLCRKYKTKIRIASFATDPFQMRSQYDLEALFTSIGMHPAEVKKALSGS